MKNIVIFDDEYNELDLKPSELIGQYITLAEDDVERYFVKDTILTQYRCPGCQSSDAADAFKRFGLQYKECNLCHTLYVSPRPSDHVLKEYYTKSHARIFWQDELSKVTGRKRQEKIIKPRYEWLVDSTQEYYPAAKTLVDINTNQYGYIEEIAKTKVFQKKILLNPYLKKVVLENSVDFSIIYDDDWDKKLVKEADVVSLFDVLDHTADVDALLKKVNVILRPGGLCFLTAILSSGFDIQVLWEQAENIYPPDRLNSFSYDGLKTLLDRHRFECIEFSTPGVLDVDIVSKVAGDASLHIGRFAKSIASKDEHVQKSFQKFLQENLLSSYGRILVRKNK